MRTLFADTSFYVALSMEARGEQFAPLLNDPQLALVTTEYVIAELGAFYSKAHLRATFSALFNLIRTDPRTTIVPASTALLDRGAAYFAAHQDKDWSLTDCISFQVMSEQGITSALSFDKHFIQAGFTLFE